MKTDLINAFRNAEPVPGHGSVGSSDLDVFAAALDTAIRTPSDQNAQHHEVSQLEALDDAWVEFIARYQEFKSSNSDEAQGAATQDLVDSWNSLRANIEQFQSNIPALQDKTTD